MATIGISVLSAPYASSVHSTPQCHSLSGYQLSHRQPPAASPPPSRPQSPALLERGGAWPCPSVKRSSSNGDIKLPMSHNHTLSSSSSNDTPPVSASAEESRSPVDRKRKAPDDEGQSPETHASGRPRPASWHPSAPVEPRLESTQLPPITMSSILNPTKGTVPDGNREVLGMQPLGSPRRLAHPSSSAHSARRLSLSPGLRQRPMITPVSPSARFVTAAGSYPGKPSTAHNSPLAHESRPGMYSTPGSPLPMDPIVVPSSTSLAGGGGGGLPPVSTSVHSTPTFHSRQTSGGQTSNPSPRETSPSTPQSVYSQFGRSSPALAGVSGPSQVPPMLHSSPYGGTESVARFPNMVENHRYPAESSAAGMPSSKSEPHSHTPGAMIPCVLDMKSGSSSQAEKRKANSDASRRFRNRKRNEVQMEQKITAQQEEMRKQAEILHRNTQEIRALFQEREYYRSERDFYREQLGRVVPPSQLPVRPASPGVEKQHHQGGSDAINARAPSTTLPAPAAMTSAPATRPPGTWTTAPSAYSTGTWRS